MRNEWGASVADQIGDGGGRRGPRFSGGVGFIRRGRPEVRPSPLDSPIIRSPGPQIVTAGGCLPACRYPRYRPALERSVRCELDTTAPGSALSLSRRRGRKLVRNWSSSCLGAASAAAICASDACMYVETKAKPASVLVGLSCSCHD
jgi:hypothetical protein